MQRLPPDLPAESVLAAVYESADIGMCVTDEDRRFVTVNRAYCRIYGYSVDELVGNPFTMVLPQEARERAGEIHDRFVRGESNETAGEWRVVAKDGRHLDILVTAGRLVNDRGAFKVTTVTDISEHKRRERRLQALLREVHHRVKNNLSALSSILALELDSHRDNDRLASVLTDSIGRIRTIAAIYEQLQHEPGEDRVDLAAYLPGLLEAIVGAASTPPHVTIDIPGDLEPVAPDLAVSLGLCLNELATNSLKYGRPAAGTPSISIAIATGREVGGEEHLDVDYRDNGPGFPEGAQMGQGNTLGLQIVSAVTGSHGGGARIDPEDRRVVHLRFLLTDIATDGPTDPTQSGRTASDQAPR